MRVQSHPEQKKRSFRILGLFFVLVLFFIFVSLGLRTYMLVKHSIYDGKNRFLLSVEEEKGTQVLSLEPNGQNGILFFDAPIRSKQIVAKLSLPIDGSVRLSQSVSEQAALSSLLAAATFSPRATYTLVTRYDLFRLYLLSLRLDERKVERVSIQFSSTTALPDSLKKDFVDDGVVSENQSIAIENGSGVSGLGQRLDRAASLLGASVVSITTARLMQKPTYIFYTGKKSYTVKRLERLLHQQAEEGDTGVADIRVIIGQRSADDELFATLTTQ